MLIPKWKSRVDRTKPHVWTRFAQARRWRCRLPRYRWCSELLLTEAPSQQKGSTPSLDSIAKSYLLFSTRRCWTAWVLCVRYRNNREWYHKSLWMWEQPAHPSVCKEDRGTVQYSDYDSIYKHDSSDTIEERDEEVCSEIFYFPSEEYAQAKYINFNRLLSDYHHHLIK